MDVGQCEPLIGGCRSAGLSLVDVGECERSLVDVSQCEPLIGGCRSV